MNVLLLIQAFVTLSLIGVILLQKSEGGALGIGGGGAGGGMFSARGTANFLTRLTAILAAIFMGNCLLMSVIAGKQLRESGSIVKMEQKADTSEDSDNKPAE